MNCLTLVCLKSTVMGLSESQNLRVNTDCRQTGWPLPGNHDSWLDFSPDELGHRLFCLSGYKRSINIPAGALRGSTASVAHLPRCWGLVGKSGDEATHKQHPQGSGFTSGVGGGHGDSVWAQCQPAINVSNIIKCFLGQSLWKTENDSLFLFRCLLKITFCHIFQFGVVGMMGREERRNVGTKLWPVGQIWPGVPFYLACKATKNTQIFCW